MRMKKGNKSTAALIRHFMRGCMAFFWVTFLLYFVDIVAYLLAPFFQQIYTDNVITRKNPEWFGPLVTCYIVLFLTRSRYHLLFYLFRVIVPEALYTLIAALLVYPLVLWLNTWLEDVEQRSMRRFV